jgi:MFS family permease
MPLVSLTKQLPVIHNKVSRIQQTLFLLFFSHNVQCQQYTYTLERLGMGCFQHRILVAAGLCFAADAMEVLLLSFLAIVLRAEWGLSREQTATLTCSVFVGSIAGSLLFGYMGDVLGRKPAFIGTATIICIFGFATAAANSYTTLVVFRFMVGLGVGGVTVPFDIFAEVCPRANRGGLLLLLGYFWTAGTILVVVLAYISLRGDVNDWRVFVALCGVPCLVSSLCTSFQYCFSL